MVAPNSKTNKYFRITKHLTPNCYQNLFFIKIKQNIPIENDY